MKLFLLAVLFPIFSYASNCRLEKPIQLSQEIYSQDIKLKNVLLSDVPKFPSEENYDALNDKLDVDVHALSSLGEERSRYVGVTVISPRTGAWMGFAYRYSSSEKFQGSLQQVGSVLAVHSMELNEDPLKNTEAFVMLEEDQITSIILTYPVYRLENGVTVFTGENQTVCVLSAEKVLGF